MLDEPMSQTSVTIWTMLFFTFIGAMVITGVRYLVRKSRQTREVSTMLDTLISAGEFNRINYHSDFVKRLGWEYVANLNSVVVKQMEPAPIYVADIEIMVKHIGLPTTFTALFLPLKVVPGGNLLLIDGNAMDTYFLDPFRQGQKSEIMVFGTDGPLELKAEIYNSWHENIDNILESRFVETLERIINTPMFPHIIHINSKGLTLVYYRLDNPSALWQAVDLARNLADTLKPFIIKKNQDKKPDYIENNSK